MAKKTSGPTRGQLPLWNRTALQDSIEQTINNLNAYAHYRHWVLSYSGGKDSSAVAAIVLWAIKQGRVPKPDSLTIAYADTGMEFPVLHATAMSFMEQAQDHGYKSVVVEPPIEKRFWVNILGRGVVPPSNNARWCTRQLKVEPIRELTAKLADTVGQKFLMLTGVRLGESDARDGRIAMACSSDAGECGQGYFHNDPDSRYDTFSPIVHWRLCHVFDWLYFGEHDYPILHNIAAVYGDDDVRTGCMQCPLVNEDRPFKNIIRHEKYSHLKPIGELSGLYQEMRQPKRRLRKVQLEYTADGKPRQKAQRMGPLTISARQYFFERVMDIQTRSGVQLIRPEEESLIQKMWADNIWPKGWTGKEPVATVLFDKIVVTRNREVYTTARLI